MSVAHSEFGCLTVLEVLMTRLRSPIELVRTGGSTETARSCERAISQSIQECRAAVLRAQDLLKVKHDLFRAASDGEDINEIVDGVSRYIRKLEDDVVKCMMKRRAELRTLRRSQHGSLKYLTAKITKNEKSIPIAEDHQPFEKLFPEAEKTLQTLPSEAQKLIGSIQSAIKIRMKPAMQKKIFLSHSNKNAELVTALSKLLKTSLRTSVADILNTSVTSTTLPAGTKIDEFLRESAINSQIFLALITPESLQSDWVSFELGARWASENLMIPLTAKGATTGSLPGPLSNHQGTSLTNESGIRSLLDQIATVLGIELEPPGSYDEEIKTVVKLAK